MTNFTVDVSQIVLFIGVMAFIVSIITEALKKWTWFDKKVPTALTVIILSLILCPVCLLGLAAYYGVAIEWFMVFASFIAAFIVALVSMDGWERVTELAEKLMVIDYFDYLKLNGLWKLTGSRLMDAQRTEYTTKQAYSFGVEHTREFRVIWHEEHNLIFLDGTWSLDGSKIIDAWQKTEVL